ncbi:MAG: winged helix-turn-helix transcriptional regulator [Elusimicrobia bacterium]|nr:winged helix-turn-helix transcriptional regulator [Elusimicrobiota bacterium]
MKTESRSKILKIINQGAGARPIELVRSLGISAQAIHRHLKALMSAGVLESRGRGPLTRYFIAGAAEVGKARRWYSSTGAPIESPSEFLCGTRDVFSARLGRLSSLPRAGLKEQDLPLVLSVIGEVGNNSFDHNLGKWRDDPGCWLETQITGGRLWICLADRGQGVLRSLSRVDPALQDEHAALTAAFERTLSGRAPEKRGNGLKFVRRIVTGSGGRGLACRSGAALVAYGELGGICREELARFSSQAGGTATLIAWDLK